MSPQTFPQFGYWGHFGQRSPLENWTVIVIGLGGTDIDNIFLGEEVFVQNAKKRERWTFRKIMLIGWWVKRCPMPSSGLDLQLETRRLFTKNTGNENKTRPRIGGWQKRSMCRKVLSNWWGCYNNTKVGESYKRGQIQNWSVRNLKQRLLIEGW